MAELRLEPLQAVQMFCALGTPPGADSTEHLHGFVDRCTEAFGREPLKEALQLVMLDPEFESVLAWHDKARRKDH